MEFTGKNQIKLDRLLSELDKLVLQFISILERHTGYVIVSGYVSILFGRARATEDVDVFIKELNREEFTSLYGDLVKGGFWCLNTEDDEEAYGYLSDGLAVRFAVKDEVIPNFEVKYAKKKLAKQAFEEALTVIIDGGKLRVSSLERHVAFKKYFLKSDKDLEDAAHIEKVFEGRLNKEKITMVRREIEDEEA